MKPGPSPNKACDLRGDKMSASLLQNMVNAQNNENAFESKAFLTGEIRVSFIVQVVCAGC